MNPWAGPMSIKISKTASARGGDILLRHLLLVNAINLLAILGYLTLTVCINPRVVTKP